MAQPPASAPGETEPDYRFTLANERTFLAYVRTALGLDAGGLGAAEFLDPSHAHLRRALALALVVLGGAVAVVGYLRWRANDEAIRRSSGLAPTRIPLVLGVAMAAVSLAALVLVLVR